MLSAEASRPSRAFDRPALALALLLLTHVLLVQWQRTAKSPMIDFYTLWSVPRALAIQPVDNIYAPSGQRQMASLLRQQATRSGISPSQQAAMDITSQLYQDRIDATGSPLIYATVGLLATGNYPLDRALFATLALACSISSLALLCLIVGYSLLSILLCLCFFIGSYEPLLSDVQVGNVNQIQLLFVSLFIYLIATERRGWAAGVIGAATMLKPNLLPILLLDIAVVIIDKRHRALTQLLAGALLGIAISYAIPMWYFHKPGIWIDFAASIPATLGLSYSLDSGNVGLSALVFSITHMHVSLFVMTTIASAFCYTVYATRPNGSRAARGSSEPPRKRVGAAKHEAFCVAGIGGALMLLSANLVWIHYYVLVIPTAIYLLRPAAADESQWLRRCLTLAALLLLSSAADDMVTTTFDQSIMMNTALLLVTALTMGQLWRERRRARDPAAA